MDEEDRSMSGEAEEVETPLVKVSFSASTTNAVEAARKAGDLVDALRPLLRGTAMSDERDDGACDLCGESHGSASLIIKNGTTPCQPCRDAEAAAQRARRAARKAAGPPAAGSRHGG